MLSVLSPSVIQVEAVDPDSGNSDQFYYKITSGNPQGFFSIDHQTGAILNTIHAFLQWFFF